MDKAFIQGIVARYNKMESVEAGWDHYDLKYLWWLLDYHHNGFPEVFQICYDCKDWQGLNNFFYPERRNMLGESGRNGRLLLFLTCWHCRTMMW